MATWSAVSAWAPPLAVNKKLGKKLRNEFFSLFSFFCNLGGCRNFPVAHVYSFEPWEFLGQRRAGRQKFPVQIHGPETSNLDTSPCPSSSGVGGKTVPREIGECIKIPG